MKTKYSDRWVTTGTVSALVLAGLCLPGATFLTAAGATAVSSDMAREPVVQERAATPIRRSTQTRQNTRPVRASPSAIEPPVDDEENLIKVLPTTRRALTATQQTRAARVQGAPYSLPFKGEDLAAGERYYRGKAIHSENPDSSQHWGYDLSAVRVVDGKWSTTKAGYDTMNPKNSDYFVSGQPVYAMGEGTIIRCWRNAPENPRPFSSALGDSKKDANGNNIPESEWGWHHPEKKSGRIGGGGNHVLVEEDSGDLVLYAHFQPGTVPTTLCPHNGQLLSAPGKSEEMDVPVAQQRRVTPGMLLGKAGNSGSSTGPHLHVHRQDEDSKPLQLRFQHGLSHPLKDGLKDLDDVTSFKGNRIPPGKVLIWPPRTIGGEYARHRFPADDYQRLFEHLADSGAMPVWLDGYSVGGKPFLNFVWRKATGAWRAYFLLTPAAYQDRVTKAVNDGFEPVQVESSLVNGQVRYSVIFMKNVPGGFLARHGLTTAQHDQVLDEAKEKNLNPVNVSVVSVGGDRRYTVLYRGQSIGAWQMKSQIPEAGYQALFNENNSAGRRPSYVNAYMHNGKAYYSVIFSKAYSGARKDRHGLSADQYQTEFTSAHDANLLTQQVSGYDGAQSNHKYIAFWHK